MQPWWRTVARALNIERHMVSVLRIAYIACSHCSHHTGIFYSVEEVTIHRRRTHLRVTQRQIDDVGTMFNSKFNTCDKVGIRAISRIIQHLDSHYLSTWSYTCLRAGVSLAGHYASHMSTMAVVIHWVIIVVYTIISVMRKLRAAIPHASSYVNMVVIDT